MTEEEWMASDDPNAVLSGLKQLTRERKSIVSYRRSLLFSLACYRKRIERSVAPLARSVAEATDLFADGQDDYTPLYRLWQEAEKAVRKAQKNYEMVGDGWEVLAYSFVAKILSVATPSISREQRATRATEALERVIGEVCKNAGEGQSGAQRKQAERVAARLLARGLREVFGNPFRPIAFDAAWRTSDVMALANGVYAERAFERMPILADALQDAGCDNADILAHLRDETATHVRGCWALDLVVGKE